MFRHCSAIAQPAVSLLPTGDFLVSDLDRKASGLADADDRPVVHVVRAPRVVRRALVLVGFLVAVVGCAGSDPAPAAPPGGPGALAAPNQSRVTAEVLDASVVDSSTLGIAPPQRLTRLTLRLSSVSAVGALPNTLDGRSGQTIHALSKDLSLAALKGRTVSLDVSLRGDERSQRYWVVDGPAAPGATR